MLFLVNTCIEQIEFFLVDVVIHDRALIRTSHNKNGGIFQSRND